ncbi:zinc-ribbon domain-containing protein [Nocardioides sp. Soil805]|uniref:zinc-ribbon domain-containing protein n=1 Tax=Nocardioides sp. Soil805 TaxID=1736416 RepID=UPI0012E38F28|nr:zinc-ribbon domain-containing protein [Nocardioides sp. Soil805]
MPSEPKRRPKPKWVPLQESILVRYPHLATEADHERAAAMGLDFAHIAPGTKVPLPWRHPLGAGGIHRWLQAGTSRVHMRAGCSVCRGYRADHTTSLAALAPELAQQWHPTRNGERTPGSVTPGSRRIAAWLCTQCTYQWCARVSSRALDGNGCPRCAGQEALTGDPTTLAVAQPQLYAELDADGVRALGLAPLRVHVRSNRRLAWICAQDRTHRWQASPAARMNGCLCPHCPHVGQSSHQERALLALLLERHEDAVGNAPAGHVRWLDRRGRSLPARCDIVVPSLRLVVEYDGLAYHHAADRRRADCVKTLALLAAGWRVVRVRECTASKRLRDLDITDDNLLQVQHRYGDRLPPLADTILAWVQELGG